MVKVKIPATSANIGAGFDAIGLAVNLYNELTMEEYEGIRIEALDGVNIPSGPDNLVCFAARKLYEICGVSWRGMKIGQVSRIPFARGLGSSSACIVGGLKGANALLGKPIPDEELIHLAASMEGHPDNTTPALTGGFVTAVLENGRVYYVKQEIGSDLRFIAIVPDFQMHTDRARAALPQSVSREDAVFNLSRAALMSVSLYSGNYHNLRVAAADRLHQPYRIGQIPCGAQVMELCGQSGAYAVFLSGAGPTIMAVVHAGCEDFGKQMTKQLSKMGLDGWHVHTLSIDNIGAVAQKIE